MQQRLKLTAIDLFAGGGGLTVGLKKAGFRVVGAVEIEPHSVATYKANHPEVHVFKQDVRTIQGEDLCSLSPSGEIDLLAGCPPCQGFSSLTSKYKTNDPRNDLILEMVRLIREIRPRAVMFENVPGLAQKGKVLFEQLLKCLTDCDYRWDWQVLQAADYGVPQRRRRLVLVAGKEFTVELPKPTHARRGIHGLIPWRTVRTTIAAAEKPVVLRDAITAGGPIRQHWHVIRQVSPQNLARLKATKSGQSWRDISADLRPACHQDENTGFSNVYGRMTWDEPSPTITGGCTTLSKGRFGHPDQDRTISVHEAALLQTFPTNYLFDTPYIDRACDIIGNAMPCELSYVIADNCANALIRTLSSEAGRNNVRSQPEGDPDAALEEGRQPPGKLNFTEHR